MLGFFKALEEIFHYGGPVGAIVDDMTHGGPFDFDVWNFWVSQSVVEAAGGTDAIRAALAEWNVESWGYMLFWGKLLFKVRLVDAQFAEWVLNTKGISVTADSDNPPESGQLNSAADFAPAGLTIVGPSGPARLAGWLLRKVFG